jgi:hypothetical protein
MTLRRSSRQRRELEVEDVEVLGDAGGLGDFGIEDRPCCRCQRSIT